MNTAGNIGAFRPRPNCVGWVETGERFLQGIKDALVKQYGEVSVDFLFITGPMKWNETLAAKLIADAKQGDADGDQVLREVAAEFLTKRIPAPNELADYVVPYLQQANSSNQSRKTASKAHKTEYRDWILALTVNVVVRRFNLNPTRNRATEEHCGCSIVALATKKPKLSEKTVQNAWHDYEGVADQRTATNDYVPQAMFSVPSNDAIGSHSMKTIPPSAQEHFLVRFPRVGSTETMSRPSNRKAERAKRAKAQRAKRASLRSKA